MVQPSHSKLFPVEAGKAAGEVVLPAASLDLSASLGRAGLYPCEACFLKEATLRQASMKQTTQDSTQHVPSSLLHHTCCLGHDVTNCVQPT